jgi:type III secretion protein U
MSQDQQGSQNKTEQPTAKKLRDLRKKGEIAVSRDLTATMCVLVSMLASLFMFIPLFEILLNLLLSSINLRSEDIVSTDAIAQISQSMLLEGMLSSLPFVGVIAVTALITAGLQSRGLFAIEHIKPKLSRINFVQGMKKIFSLNTLMELLKLIFKALLLVLIVYVLLLQMLPLLFNARYMPAQGLFLLSGKVLATLMWIAIIGFSLTTAFDVWFQHWNFIKRNRMSLEEVRREYRDNEGDPHIRGKRRQMRQEMSMHAMLENVRKASVVVVNPTHIAVALYYLPGVTDLPVVLGKGEGHIAEEIRAIAVQENIPILHDIRLARRLQAEAPIDQYIPDEFIEPVAAVMRWLKKSHPRSRS